MKKRLLALILTLVMVVSILPGSVLADGTPVPIADPQVGNNVTASSNGITVNKYLSTDGHGNYFLTMEAYASNKVSTTTETTPLDIVLVLDVSGSMDDNINRNDEKKLTALKNAVNSFIDSVTESAVETEANHQIGIVTFADNAQTEAGLTPVQNGGADTLKTEFSNLHADGATRADRGMEAAKEVLCHSQPNAKKVVIMFTDGEPNSFSGYDADVAHDAVNAAKDMKDAGATVYTIGIFSGANPSDTNGQANKYMNAMSSNYPLAVSTSEWKDGLFGGHLEYSITLNERAQGNYYFASSSAEGLNDVFQNIANSETSSTLKVNPDETAVLSDTLSQYFNFPEGLAESSGEITVKQVPASGKVGDHFTWNDGGATDITSSVRVNVEGDQLTVTGFDYKENAVTEKTENGGAAVYTGSKLVVTFPIEVDMNACLADPIDSQYYPTNSTASGSRAGLSYKGENSGSNDTSTKLSRSPEVLLEDLDANGTDVTVEVFVDGNKVSNPLDYVTIERHGADSTYYYFKQVDLVDGKLTYDFNYNPDNGHDCVDLKLGIVNNAYVLQGVHSHQSYGNSGTENVKQEGPSYKIDNVTANNEGKVDCTIYLRSKYSVEYYQGNEKLSGSAYTDSNVYIEKADVDSTTAQDSYPTSGTPAWMDWRNTNCNTSIDLPALPDAETGYTSDGWFLGSAEGTKYEPDTSSDPVAMAQAAACAEQNVIKFYSTATQNEYTVTYAPGGHGTLDGANDEGNVVHTGLTYGATTPPAPEVTPDGTYYFTGWDPEVATTVTENVTYTAQYAARTEITVKANSATHTYDGTEKTVSGFETLTFEMPNGVKYTVEGLSASASGTDAGTYPVEVTGKAVVKDAQGHDVTSQFIVKTQNGELEITKRNVTLTSATAQKEYDGKALTNDTVTVGGDGFATGEGATYTVTGSQTVKGSSANTFTYELNSNTKADNYTITKIEGTLTVIDRESKYEITVLSKSGTAKYSGSAQTVTGFETLTFEVEGQTYTVTGLTASGSGTNVGSYPNVISGTAVVLDANRNDVTGQFTVKKQQGTLEIIKRNVTLTSASDSKEYDGKALTNSNVTVSGEGFVTGEGATYNVTGSQTLVGTSQNAFTYELNEGTLADNYNITKAEGQLNVTDRDAKFAITLEANSASIMYDGEPHEVSGFKTTTFTFDGVIFKVENITAEANGTDANEYTTRTDGTAVVKDAAGNDVTSQFAVTVTPGKLTITKRNVTLTSATDTKMYDGTALTNDEVTVSGDGFVEGEGATYNVTGSQTLVGESRNAFTYVLNAGTKADNYNITTNFGTLTITSRPDGQKYEITVKANSGTYIYDGTEKTVSGFETLTFEMPNGVKYTVEGLSASASGTDAGTYPVEVTGKAVVKDAQGHDVTSQFIVKTQNGELEITKRNVTLTSATAQKEYDGKALTNDTVTVGGDGFATGEGATYTVTGSQTVKGSSANTFTYELNSNTKADNYTITKIEGTLTVIDRESKYEITVVSKSGTAKYSGSAQTVTGFETLTFEVEGQTYTVTGLTASGSGTNVGSYPNVISGTAVVLDANRNDVTGQFTVKKQQGTLEIIKRNVTLTSASDSKEYDGKALTNSNVTVSGEGFVTGEGATYNVTGSQTLVGTSQNAFTYELNEGTLADNYNITKAEGQLNVTDRDAKFAITLEANSASIMYDGEPHEVSGFKTTTFTFDGVIFKVENITAEANGTDANEYTTRTDGTAVVKDAAGNDVTSQFAVTVTPGKLTITKRNVTLTSATDTKMYDGTALTNDEVTVSGDGFVEGEGATYNVTGSQTLVGESRNAFTYVLNAGTKADNYNITTNFGTLTITDRPDSEKYEITVKANSGTFTYDGTEKTVSGFETLTFTVNGQTYTVSGLNASASATSLGTYEVAVTGTAVVKDAGQNDVTRQFTVKTEKGTLKIQGQLIYDGNAQQGGTVTNVPTDTNQYEANNEVKLSSQIPSHSNVMDKAVCLIGWSLTKSDKIYSAGEQYPNVIETVKFDKTSITVYAVWGYDTNGDEIPDATQVMVEPVDITVYVGGNGGYEGVVNGSGTITGSNSLPEPGFYFTLPYDMNKAISEAAGKDPTDAVDLTNYLKLTGTGTEGTGRHWTIQLYDPDGNSTAYGKYVYSFVVPTGQDPVRMEFTDEAGNTKISDEFNIVDALYQEYVMAIYKGNVEGTSVKAEATINGVKMEAPVGQTTGTLTIRGVTGEEVTTSVGASVTAEPENITAVYGSNKPTYYINGSQIEVTNQDAVKLLVDEIVNADGIHETLLDMADVELTEDMDYEFKYLDLVDTSNGNVWVTMGEHDSLTVYWPYPDGTNANDDFTIVHYKGLDRDFDVSDLEEQDYTLEVFSTENGKLECTSYGIKFNVSSFSPFVLIWNDDDNNWPPIIIPEVPEDNTPNWLNLDDHYAYIVGYNDGMVKPGNNITRAEVATIFFRLLTDEAREYFWSTDSGFSDVKSGDWYNNAVSTMVNAGIITGYSDGTFKPNANITRAEFATIAARFLSNPYSLKDRFYDTEGHWAEVYINRAAEIGWIGGYPDGSFKPDRYITRAEAVTLVNNVLGREPHEDYLLEDMIRWPDNPKTAWFYEDVQEATNSHDYRWSSSKSYEIWTELLKNRDWSKLEKEWANAYSAPGGSVIG